MGVAKPQGRLKSQGGQSKLKKALCLTVHQSRYEKQLKKTKIRVFCIFALKTEESQAGKWQPRTIPTLGFASGRKESRLPFACFRPLIFQLENTK